MFFYVQGPNQHDLMPLEKVFDRREVKQVGPVNKELKIEVDENRNNANEYRQAQNAKQAYQSVSNNDADTPVLLAQQIMSSPVLSLASSITVDYAIELIRVKKLRHFPVVSSTDKVIGIVSDRDIFQYVGGLSQSKHNITNEKNKNIKIERLMQSPVLTVSEKTDVRYIAKLFVERRIGSMPVVSDGELKGIITRSDILNAVMNHYALELWI